MVVTAQSFPPLPETVLVSMRVHYSVECPEEFVSDGFVLAETEEGFSIAPESRLRFDIGGIATHHDALKFTLCTRNDDIDTADESEAAVHDVSFEPPSAAIVDDLNMTPEEKPLSPPPKQRRSKKTAASFGFGDGEEQASSAGKLILPDNDECKLRHQPVILHCLQSQPLSVSRRCRSARQSLRPRDQVPSLLSKRNPPSMILQRTCLTSTTRSR